MKITRYYVQTPHGATIGPFFTRRGADRAAQGRSIDPLLWRGGQVITGKPKPRQPLSEPDLIVYARAHVTSPGAHALLDEVERGWDRAARLRSCCQTDPEGGHRGTCEHSMMRGGMWDGEQR